MKQNHNLKNWITKKEAEEYENEFTGYLKWYEKQDLKNQNRAKRIVKEWEYELQENGFSPEMIEKAKLARMLAKQARKGGIMEQTFKHHALKILTTYRDDILPKLDKQKRARRLRMLCYYCRTFFEVVQMRTDDSRANILARYEQPLRWALNPKSIKLPHGLENTNKAIIALQDEENAVKEQMNKDLEAINKE